MATCDTFYFFLVEDHTTVKQRKTSNLKMLRIYWYRAMMFWFYKLFFLKDYFLYILIKSYINDVVNFYHSSIILLLMVWNRSSILWLFKVILVSVITLFPIIFVLRPGISSIYWLFLTYFWIDSAIHCNWLRIFEPNE